MSDQADAEPTGPTSAAKKKAVAKKAVKKTAAKKATSKEAAPAAGTAARAKKTTAKKAATKTTTARKATTKKATPKPAGQDAAAPPLPDTPPAPATAEQPPQREPQAPTGSGAFPPPGDIERPWLASYPPLVPESYPYPDVALTRLLDDAAKDFPESIAMDFLGRTTTYRRLLDHVDRFATALQALGVVKGDRIGIVLPNTPQHVIAFFATLRVGAIVVGIDPSVEERGLAARINDAGCRVLVVLDPIYAKLEQLKGQVPTVEHVIGTAVEDYLPPLASAAFRYRHRRNPALVRKIPATEGVLRFLELIRRHPPTVTQAPLSPSDDVAMLAYPGAGVADARAVMLTHRNLLTNVFQVRLWIPDVQAGRETILCAVPFWQAYGVTTGLSLGMLGAATMALAPSSDRGDLLQIIDKRKPTLFPATGAIIELLATAPQLRRHDLSTIRAALCDTSLLAPDVVAAFEGATGGRLREGLGIPEATALTHANPVYGKAKPDRVGLPLSDTACVLVDRSDRTRLAPAGERGELAIRGPQVMKGYWNRPEETAAALADGWLLTGRLAEIDEDGYYAILGRTDAATPGGSTAAD